MFATLEAHHRQIAAGIEELRKLCALPTPDLGTIALARLRLSRLSSARSRFITKEVIPALLEHADSTLRAELDEVQRAFTGKRLEASHHVIDWSTRAIEADWDGYKLASRAMLEMMEEQIDRERATFGERLRYLGT